MARAFAPGALAFLATTLWTGEDSRLGRLLPGRLANKRACPAIPGERVRALAWPEIARLGLSRAVPNERFRSRMIDARNRLFDRFALREVQRARPRAVLSHPSCCLETLRWCRAEGIACVIALPLAHPAVVRRFRDEELARWPGASPDEWDLSARSPALEARYEEELRLADLILCPSPFVADSCAEAGLPREKLAVVPYGADPFPEGDLECSRLRGSAGGPARFLFAGYLSRRKGVPYLLEAFSRLPKGSATLELAGDWHGRWRPPLPESASWLGKLSREVLGEAFARADVFAFPSLCEGSALVTYEAMAAGLPLIATRESGSWAEDGANALFVPPADAGALEAALRACLDPERLASLREEARARRNDFLWPRARAALREAVFGFLRDFEAR